VGREHLVTLPLRLHPSCCSPGRRTPTTLCPAAPVNAGPHRLWNRNRFVRRACPSASLLSDRAERIPINPLKIKFFPNNI
jgi:hypothetical protein